MNSRSLKELVRRVLSSGLAVGGASQALEALPAPVGPAESSVPSSTAESGSEYNGELVVRPSRPKVLLRALDATRVALISSHRSHRSHSSHRSSSTGSPPPRRTPPNPAPRASTARQPATGAQGIMGSANDSSTLGQRVLKLGMRGKDVDQLIVLLVKAKLLTALQIPQESLFNEEVERAVKGFQVANKIPADGAVDYRTLLLLRAQ